MFSPDDSTPSGRERTLRRGQFTLYFIGTCVLVAFAIGKVRWGQPSTTLFEDRPSMLSTQIVGAVVGLYALIVGMAAYWARRILAGWNRISILLFCLALVLSIAFGVVVAFKLARWEGIAIPGIEWSGGALAVAVGLGSADRSASLWTRFLCGQLGELRT